MLLSHSFLIFLKGDFKMQDDNRKLIKDLATENARLKSEIESYKLKEKHNKEIMESVTAEMVRIKEEFVEATSRANIVREEYKKLIAELKDVKKEYATEMKNIMKSCSDVYRKEKSKIDGFVSKFK